MVVYEYLLNHKDKKVLASPHAKFVDVTVFDHDKKLMTCSYVSGIDKLVADKMVETSSSFYTTFQGSVSFRAIKTSPWHSVSDNQALIGVVKDGAVYTVIENEMPVVLNNNELDIYLKQTI